MKTIGETMSREKQIEEISEKEKQQVLELAKDLTPILDRYVDISPRQYASVEYSNKYRDMGVDIDLVGIVTDLLNAGYRKQSEGEWVPSDIPQEKYVCSVCGGACWYYDFRGDVAKSRYCPNCGSKMKAVQNERDFI